MLITYRPTINKKKKNSLQVQKPVAYSQKYRQKKKIKKEIYKRVWLCA